MPPSVPRKQTDTLKSVFRFQIHISKVPQFCPAYISVRQKCCDYSKI